jgi:hypothetical protein
MENSRIGRSLIVKDDKGENHFLSIFTDIPEVGKTYRFVIGTFFGVKDVIEIEEMVR